MKHLLMIVIVIFIFSAQVMAKDIMTCEVEPQAEFHLGDEVEVTHGLTYNQVEKIILKKARPNFVRVDLIGKNMRVSKILAHIRIEEGSRVWRFFDEHDSWGQLELVEGRSYQGTVVLDEDFAYNVWCHRNGVTNGSVY